MKDFLNWNLTCKMHALGYDGSTLMYIDYEEDLINNDSAELIGAKPAILFSAAFRWFREKFGLNHEISYAGREGEYTAFVNDYVYGNNGNSPSQFTYEEAETACLQKLIEIVEQSKLE